MLLAGFEPTILVFKRAKTFHACDRQIIIQTDPIITGNILKIQEELCVTHYLGLLGTAAAKCRTKGGTGDSNVF
jgi:hypothetical protein